MTVAYRPDAWYLCFTLDTDETQAAARYAAKYGAPPETVLEHDGLLRLGPISDARAQVTVSAIDNAVD